MKSPEAHQPEARGGEIRIEATHEGRAEALVREIVSQGSELERELTEDVGRVESPEAKIELGELAAETRAVVAGFADVASETVTESRESLRQTYEYHDAAGKLICIAEAEYSELGSDDADGFAPKDFGVEKISGRLLKSFRLKGENGEIDLLELAGASGLKVIVADSRLNNYMCLEKMRKSLVPPLENLLDVGIALHELGHAAQYQDEAYSEVKDLYRVGHQKLESVDLSRLEAIMAALPETQALRPLLDNLKDLRQRIDDGTSGIRDKESEIFGLQRRLDKQVAKKLETALPFSQELATANYGSKAEARAALEKMGFAVVDAKAEKPQHKNGGGWSFGSEDDEAETEPELTPLSEEMLHTGGLSDLHAALFRNFPVDRSEMSYDQGSGELTIEFPFDFSYGTDKRLVILRTRMSQEDFADLQDMRQVAAEKIAAAQSEVGRLKGGVASAREAISRLDEDGEIDKLAKAPQRMLERDATRRAFQWLHRVKQTTGADVFSQIKADAAQLKIHDRDADDGCEGSMAAAASQDDAEDVVTSKAYLAQAYRTYGATLGQMRIRQPGGTGPGKMPRAKKKG